MTQVAKSLTKNVSLKVTYFLKGSPAYLSMYGVLMDTMTLMRVNEKVSLKLNENGGNKIWKKMIYSVINFN